MHKGDIRPIRDAVRFIASEHDIQVTAFFPKDPSDIAIWRIQTFDYALYTSEDFKMTITAIREKYPNIKFISCHLKPSAIPKKALKIK